MCGIAGFYSDKEPINKELFDQMVDIIEYRGPNDRGVYFDGNLALGHRRLSIFDISSAGHQPFCYEDKYVLVYNGEIYNYIEIREELKEKGYEFSTSTDTEVLITAYDYYGTDCISKFKGMWSFALYDIKKRMIFCSRDRFGVKPFYYYYKDDKFIFASEIKQILSVLEKGQTVNRKRIMEYMIRGQFDYTEETMINDIYQLRGGNNLIFDIDSNSIKIERYYDLSNVKTLGKDEVTFEEAAIGFREKFLNSVELRLRSDVPLGYCLSGGLDSSAIVCAADKIIKSGNLDIEQNAVSSCFHEKEYDEQEYIDEVIRNTSVNIHKTFPEGNNLFADLDNVIWHMDEPFSSACEYAQWNVFKAAKEQDLTVMIDGQGADEQLAGYTGFYSVILAEYLKKFRFIKFFRELIAYKNLRAKTEKYVKSYKIIIEALISAYLPRRLQKYGKLKFFYLRQGFPFEEKDIKDTIMGLDLYPANDSRQYILDNFKCNLSMLLRFEDRNSMANSIESRVPFLDHELVEELFKMPIEYKIQNGITKCVLREGLKDILPEKILKRYSKLGYVTPEEKWANDHPEQYRKELEEAANYLDGLLDKTKLMNWYDSLSGNVQRMDHMLFRIICAGKWIKIFNLKVE